MMPKKYGHILRSFADRKNNWNRGFGENCRFCRWECRTILKWRLRKAQRKCAWEQRCLVPEKRRTSRCASDCMGLSVTAFQSVKTQGRASNQDDDDQLLKEGLPKKWRNRIENHEAEENADVGNAKPSSAVAVDGSW